MRLRIRGSANVVVDDWECMLFYSPGDARGNMFNPCRVEGADVVCILLQVICRDMSADPNGVILYNLGHRPGIKSCNKKTAASQLRFPYYFLLYYLLAFRIGLEAV